MIGKCADELLFPFRASGYATLVVDVACRLIGIVARRGRGKQGNKRECWNTTNPEKTRKNSEENRGLNRLFASRTKAHSGADCASGSVVLSRMRAQGGVT